jgi:DNA-binding response OmpR family regulator
MSKRVLIVDDDPWIRRMVGTVIERRGHRVETAREGREGFDKALEFHPDLIITDVMMPGMDGWSFVRALRSHREMSLVPVIFLTALNKEEDRILGFRLGADDYLAKPFRFEELDLRVEKVLRTSDRIQQCVRDMAGQDGDGAVGLRGDLGQLGVSAVLTILEMERKSGILVLRNGSITGRVFMREGRALAAFFDEQPAPRGPDAVFEMLTWRDGRFEFTALEVDMEDQIKTSTTHLLMEGARRIDEATAAARG